MLHTPSPPFAFSSGHPRARIAIVGEAWGAEEDYQGKPFVGPAGRVLRKLAGRAGLDISLAFITNVCALRPYELSGGVKIKSNKFALLCEKKRSEGNNLPKLGDHGYLRREFHGELERLAAELREVQPNIVIPLGGIALWAFTGKTNIGSVRGAITEGSVLGDNAVYKILPTYHPSFLLQGGAKHTGTVIADLGKAERQSQFREIRRPGRLIAVAPTLGELREHIERALRAPLLSVDIETAGGHISHVGVAESTERAFVVPFVGGHAGSYWATLEEECEAWELLAHLLSSPVPKLFQNGMFDISWFLSEMGIAVRGCLHDTMLLQHSHFPEMQKGLGYLGSIWAADGEIAWKQMRTRHREGEGVKRDE